MVDDVGNFQFAYVANDGSDAQKLGMIWGEIAEIGEVGEVEYEFEFEASFWMLDFAEKLKEVKYV